ncbi:hypothetical protein J7E62_26430 [Variovorax paradoxus]|nr:hypothetical protein [Variovorax paradoxus]
MFSWLMLFASGVFAFLAYDAGRLSSSARDVPYALTAKGLGQDVAHVSLAEQEKRKQYNARFGLGDLSQSVWLFGILSATCLAVATYSFFE